jgi:hypothetical protein
METYWIFHLAASWRGLSSPSPAKDTLPRSSIRAAAVQMVFASRSSSQEFITPEHVNKLEAWCGQAVLEALCATEIPQDVCANDLGSIEHVTNVCDSRSNCTPRKGALGTWRVFLWGQHREVHLSGVPQITMGSRNFYQS